MSLVRLRILRTTSSALYIGKIEIITRLLHLKQGDDEQNLIQATATVVVRWQLWEGTGVPSPICFGVVEILNSGPIFFGVVKF